MLTRHNVQVGDLLRCIALHSSTDRSMNIFIAESGVRVGQIYRVKQVPTRGENDHWVDLDGIAGDHFIPLDIFEKVDPLNHGPMDTTTFDYGYARGGYMMPPAVASFPIKAGDRFIAKRNIPNSYGNSIYTGETVTVIHTHNQYSSNVMLSGKGSTYFSMADPNDFERVSEQHKDKELLRELLAFSKSIPDPKLEPLKASMKLSDLIDLIQEKLNQP